MTATLDRPGSVEADFLALVCADDELLRAEFEEIVAAGWGPPPRPVPGRGGDRGPDEAGRPAGTADEPPRRTPPEAGDDGRARQRSPPGRPVGHVPWAAVVSDRLPYSAQAPR